MDNPHFCVIQKNGLHAQLTPLFSILPSLMSTGGVIFVVICSFIEYLQYSVHKLMNGILKTIVNA